MLFPVIYRSEKMLQKVGGLCFVVIVRFCSQDAETIGCDVSRPGGFHSSFPFLAGTPELSREHPHGANRHQAVISALSSLW